MMEKIIGLKRFSTQDEYNKYKGLNEPKTKDDTLDPHMYLVTFEDNSKKILSEEEYLKYENKLKNA